MCGITCHGEILDNSVIEDRVIIEIERLWHKGGMVVGDCFRQALINLNIKLTETSPNKANTEIEKQNKP